MSVDNILITGVGGDIGQGIIKCIKDEYKYNLIVGIDIDLYAAGGKEVDIFLKAPKVKNEIEYEEFILKVCKDYKITHIIPSTELEINFFNENISKFDQINILINKSNIINIFMDKYKTVEFFRENNIPFPKTFDIYEYKDELEFPLIVKSKDTRGSKGVYLINNNIELEDIKRKIKDGIVQEYIGNEEDEYTMGVFSDGKNIYSIAFKRVLGLGSLSRFVELVIDEELSNLALNISKSAQLKGSINVQLRKHKGKYIPFEINPRLSSTVAFRHRFGFKDVIWWLNIIGKDNEINYKPKYKNGIGVKTVGEVFFEMEEY